ncbi:glycoside hydrolase family 26 protein [Phytohabitans kaempferiae]|uniref:Glycoside hydrolase family 26 protein n=1 Tax=Phytohabitans kaempferiae TaxID=1620943 RepID=A0ABV6LV99_9ACTN
MRRAILAAVLVLAACTEPQPVRTPSPPTVAATDAGPFDAGPVAPPSRGALLGAWVKPESYSQPGRLAAINGLQRDLGRPLDIVNTYRRFDQEFGTESDEEFLRQGLTIMLSWASGDTRSITAGRHDDLIRAQARSVRKAGVPVLLRFRWEMDRPNLRATMWSAADFIAAWRYVWRIFEQERVGNASWVWCPTAEGFERGEAPDFYPGDDVVDWTCVDVYASSELRPIGELMAPFLRWASTRDKPIIVGEFGVAAVWGSTARAEWLRDAVRTFKANPQIKAVSYFESDDDKGPTGHFRLANDPPAFDAFVELGHDRWFNPH